MAKGVVMFFLSNPWIFATELYVNMSPSKVLHILVRKSRRGHAQCAQRTCSIGASHSNTLD